MVDARSFGAVGDGLSDDTGAIQRTIDAAAAAAARQPPDSPPAQAVLSLGIFLSGTVFLRPRVTLYIDSTAVLKASLNHSKFVVDQSWPGQAALVAGYSADGSGVAGRGVIDGRERNYGSLPAMHWPLPAQSHVAP